jgi:hypothetical protein
VIEDDFVCLSSPTNHKSFTDDHEADIHQVATDINAAIQAAWTAASPRGNSRYVDAHVLLLSWEEDDLGVYTEICSLRSVFENIYHFHVYEHRIPSLKPDDNINRRIIKLLELDSKDTLLIVYYAGHARGGQQSNDAPIWFP